MHNVLKKLDTINKRSPRENKTFKTQEVEPLLWKGMQLVNAETLENYLEHEETGPRYL